MTATPLIRSVMTPFPYAIDVGAPLNEARRMIQKHRIRHLPVKDGDRLVGLITDRDIKLVLGPNRVSGDADGPTVEQACLFDVYTVEMTTPLELVAAEMARRRIGSALVTKEGRLAGIFTVTDACRCLAELLAASGTLPSPGDDVA